MITLRAISAHIEGGWQGQYNRMDRWFKMSVDISSNNRNEGNRHIYFDTLYTCFQNIFFLKDWLINDAYFNKEKLNSFINANQEMGLCRDICNGTKHFSITNPSIDKNFSFIQQYQPYHKIWGTEPYEYIILADGQSYSPLDLALKCIRLWDNFLEENGWIKQSLRRPI